MARRGGGAGRPGRKKALGKKVVYTLIGRKEKSGQALYELLDELVEKHHEHLAGARIALAYHLGWKPDVDGRQKLGMCRKASDLDRELARGENAWDFVILLDTTFFNSSTIEAWRKLAVLDHELCHAAQKLDPRTGDQQEDERGRKLWRLRKHDIEDFAEIGMRYGCYTRMHEEYYRALQQGAKQSELFRDKAAKAPAKPAATAH